MPSPERHRSTAGGWEELKDKGWHSWFLLNVYRQLRGGGGQRLRHGSTAAPPWLRGFIHSGEGGVHIHVQARHQPGGQLSVSEADPAGGEALGRSLALLLASRGAEPPPL